MSYDIELLPPQPRCEHCGRDFETVSGPDPTYNLTPIFHLALTGVPLWPPVDIEAPSGLRVLSGQRAGATTEMLRTAILRALDPAWRARLVALEPENGWGNLHDARVVLDLLLELSLRHHDHVWQIR